MSLNWKEIDAILAELPLEGAHIQKIRQPSFRTLVFDCYSPGKRFTFFVNIEKDELRVHSLRQKPASEVKLQRFAQLLRSRIQGGRITEAGQIGAERVVRLKVVRGGEPTLLWIRLWGGAGNVIATNEDGHILDAYFRRPKRGEISGGHYEAPESRPPKKDYEVRDLPGDGSFNERIEVHYATVHDEAVLLALRAKAEKALAGDVDRFEIRVKDLEARLAESSRGDEFQHWGDLITSSIHLVKSGSREVTLEDYLNGGTPVSIELDPTLSPQENAQKYYSRAKKARRGHDLLTQDMENARVNLERSRALLSEVGTWTDVAALEELVSTPTATPAKSSSSDSPGLQFTSGPFAILVGRTAKENDTLLRRHVKGNDWWFHTRDYPGGYVFVRAPKGKTLPLETMLDAGNLALHFSKAKASGRAELYYTQVKYLRRAKEGPVGLVLPTQEKNLSIVLDEPRLDRLLGRKGR